MANKNIPSEKSSNVTKKHGFNVNFTRNPLEVEEPVIKTLIQYWNVKLGVFELPHIDTTPTLEEYQKLLGLFQLDKIYYQGLPTKEEDALKLLNIKDNPGIRTAQRPFSGLKQKPLKDHLVHLVENRQWVFARPVLAFLIYGLVLFPSTQGMVDTAAMDVFYKVSKMVGVSPVPAILADTFSSLTKCYIKQKGSIGCCVQLLYLWVATHLHPARSQNINKDLILRFSRWTPFSLTDVIWREKLENVTDKCYGWKNPWYKDDTVLMACGNFSGVPLIGPRSSFLYFPCLVLRQMGWTQTFPEGEIESFFLEGEEGRAKEGKFLQAWKNMKILGTNELQQQIKTEVASYIAWGRARTESFTPLLPFPKNSGPTSKEQSLQKKTEVLEAQLKATRIEKREIETIFSVYDREKVHLKRKIKDLEEENPSST
ncbi:hypothetical protein RIF29_15690 [Crotalaria pallida]|uniref:DUF7745 domain-containing protein n=1 Tax=Crotalaria pallida TaxID=3830 RepID=A0AAN9FFF6_CROPI